MLTKKEIKDIQSLQQKKFRAEQGLFIAEGPKIVQELVRQAPEQIRAIYATEIWTQQYGHLKKLIKAVSDSELQKISHSTTPNHVLAVLQQWPQQAPDITNKFCLYLDAIQDPGNMGTILRIADWFGVTQVVCAAGCADVYHPKVVQASMASIARVKTYEDLDGRWIQKQTGPIYAATLDGSSTFSKAHTGILIIGNESKGIRPELLQLANQKITIPRRGTAESLNAAVATGILLSHLLS